MPSDRRDDEDDYDRPRSRRRDRDDDYEDDRPKRRRRREDDDDDYEHDRPRRSEPQSNGLAVAGLVLGLLSFFTVGLTGIPGGIISLIALSKPVGRGSAVAGLLLSGLGIVAWVAAGVLLYDRAVEFVKFGSGRQRDSNNLKQIGLGLHNYHDSHGMMDGPFVKDFRAPNGVNRDLSWRVSLLPYIEQDFVYRQFDTSQAWNSPRNRVASDTPIRTYTSPYEGTAASTQTPYRVFYGGGALFDEDGKPVKLTEITDGTSNTIMAAHAFEKVSWAEPRELKYDPRGTLPQLWAKDAHGTHVVMADGSVRFLTNRTSEQTIRGAITRAGGERLPTDW